MFVNRPWARVSRRERLLWIVALVAVAVFGGIGVAVAATSNESSCTGTPYDPATGHVKLDCYIAGVPTVAPTGSPSPTTSPSPSPSASPSPSTTTPSPSTTSPTPSPTTSTTAPGACPVAGSNVPGGKDPWGGCWPGPGNTGVPAGTALTNYTGPCTITVANTVIDGKRVTCATLDIRAANVVIRNSLLDGSEVSNGDLGATGTTNGYSFTIIDSTVRNGGRSSCLCIGEHDYTAIRVETIGAYRGMLCAYRCVIQDSWMHGQQLIGAQHASGLREQQGTQATHNSIACDSLQWDDTTSLGCSGALVGYADFAPIHNNTIRRNLILSSPAASFCVYGGYSSGKQYSNDPTDATYQVFTENVFQHGAPGVSSGIRRCADYGPVTAFDSSGVGNVWQGNVWDDGKPVPAEL